MSQKTILNEDYDFLNSTIAQRNAKEEIALPIRGRKNNLTQRDIFDYFAIKRLGLNQKIIAEMIQEYRQAIPQWQQLISVSFLSLEMQGRYSDMLEARARRLDFFN